MEEKQMYGLLTTYRERGYYLRRLEQYEKAKQAYDVALPYYPEDRRLLIGRSQVCADAVRPLDAFTNADLALQINKNDMSARNLQALALFVMSDFERSLIMNYHGSRRRNQPPYFHEGINQGLATIEDCVGRTAGPVLKDFLPIIKSNIKASVDEHEPVGRRHVSRIPVLHVQKQQTQLEIRRNELLSRVLAMKYLGPMANDKFFLQKLSEDRRLIGANKRGSQELKQLVSECLQTLSQRQEMLRSQRPYYSIKWAEKTESRHQNVFKKKLLERDREINTMMADKLIRTIEQSLRANKMMDLISKAARFQKFMDNKTKRNLPDKNTYMDRLYRAVGEGYLQMHRLSYTLSEQGNRRRIAFLMGLPVERPRSFDSVVATYPFKLIKLEDAIERSIETLKTCENENMRCWLLYEIACLQNKQKNFAMAKYYAKKCQRTAEALANHAWWLNACFVLMSGDMKNMNINDIRTAVEEAVAYSKQLAQPVTVQAFLFKCLEIANEPIAEDEHKALRKRENEILSVMEEPTRGNTQVLFRNMWTVPFGRRFRVLPSKPDPKDMPVERRKLRQHGLTVVPGKQKPLDPPPKSDISGFMVFDVSKDGSKG